MSTEGFPTDNCNPYTLRTVTADGEADRVTKYLELVEERPGECWRICDRAGVMLELNCAGVCEKPVDDAARPLPEEEVWGVPPGI